MLFEIPDDFRAFMQEVVAYLDLPGDKYLDAENALKHAVGYGGRVDGRDTYRFSYITSDGEHRYEVTLKEAAVRAIAEGVVYEVDAECHDLARSQHRRPQGLPLMIWGEYGDDALHVRDHRELITALDALHDASAEQPRVMRMWTACDDQVVAVVNGALCALYVVESVDGYATSTGDANRQDSFEARDHDGKPLLVPYSDCVPWDRARNALLQFHDHGNLGPEISIDGRIPSMLLMMGDVDRAAALAARAEPPRELRRSSLPRMSTPIPDTLAPDGIPVEDDEADVDLATLTIMGMDPIDLSAWARRLLDHLQTRALIELGGNLDEISYQLGGLLQAHGTEAESSIDTADWLANEIGALRGIRMFATGGDLQIALRRSRDLIGP